MARKIMIYSSLLRMIKYSPFVACDTNNVTGINGIVETCPMIITSITSDFRDICIDKPPLPTDVFDALNTPISCVNSTDIDDVERPRSYSSYTHYQVFYNTVRNKPPSASLGVKI